MGREIRTFLSQSPPLVQLKLILIPRLQNRSVAPRPRKRELHRLVKDLEALDLLDGLDGGLGAVEHDERLSLRLEVALGYDVDDRSVVGKHGMQDLFESLGLDALLEVPHVDAVRVVKVFG